MVSLKMRASLLLKGSLFLTLAMVFSRGAVVLASALVARAFGAEAFALFTFVHLTATSFSNIAMLGMMNGLPRFCASLSVDPSEDALAQVIISMGVVIIGLTIAIIAVLGLPAELIGLSDPARKGVLAALILGIGLNNLLVGISNGFERFGWVTVSSFGLGIVLIGGTAIAVLMDAPYWPLRIYLFATVISLLILIPIPGGLGQIFRGYLAQGAKLDRANFRAVWDYLGPMFLVTVMTNTGLWLAGRALIGGAGGSDAFAEYAMGLQWFGLAQMGSNVISRTIMPRLARNVWNKDNSDQKKTMEQALLFSLLGALIILSCVLLGSPIILPIYGSGLMDAQWALILFVSASVVAAPISVLTSLFIAERRYNTIFVSTSLTWSITVIGAYALRNESANYVIACIGIAYASQTVFLWWAQKHQKVSAS